jgi:hypothetical protein
MSFDNLVSQFQQFVYASYCTAALSLSKLFDTYFVQHAVECGFNGYWDHFGFAFLTALRCFVLIAVALVTCDFEMAKVIAPLPFVLMAHGIIPGIETIQFTASDTIKMLVGQPNKEESESTNESSRALLKFIRSTFHERNANVKKE